VIIFFACLAIHAWWFANGKRNRAIRIKVSGCQLI
jgi:hypothetical protein